MLNQVAVEALYSATYVENYLDSVENLPDDVQRHLSRIREIDVQCRGHLRDADNFYDQWLSCLSSENESANSTKRNRTMTRMQQSLIAAQELGDEKLHIVTQLQELIDQKTRQLEQDFSALDYGKDDSALDSATKELRPSTPMAASPISSTAPISSFPTQTTTTTSSAPLTASNERYSTTSNNTTNANDRPTNKRARRTRNDNTNSGMDMNNSTEQTTNTDTNPQKTSASSSTQSAAVNQKKTNAAGGKKKKRKSGRQANSNAQNTARDTRDETPPVEEAIDPDEPTYCLCDQISFGEMILCDNDLCPIEWFHFSCVSLMSKPKGKWFCPNCRGERPNVMKPKAQFLKELERYNKEKEEKT